MTSKSDSSPLETAVARFRAARADFAAAARDIPFEKETLERQEKILACRRKPEDGQRRFRQVADRKTAKANALKESRPPLDLPVRELVQAFDAAQNKGTAADFLREKVFEIEISYRKVVANIDLGAQETRLLAEIMDEVTACKSALGAAAPGRLHTYARQLESSIDDEDRMFGILSSMGARLQELYTGAQPYLPSGYPAAARAAKFSAN